VTIELAKENFAPPAAPIAIGGDKPTSRAFIAIRGALGRYRPADPSQSPYPRSSVVHGAPGCILDHRNRWRDETVTCRWHRPAGRHHTLQRTYHRRGRQPRIPTLRPL